MHPGDANYKHPDRPQEKITGRASGNNRIKQKSTTNSQFPSSSKANYLLPFDILGGRSHSEWYFYSMIILDGRVASKAIKEKLSNDVKVLVSKGERPPHLAAILVGKDPASEFYVSSKVKSCEETGFKSTLVKYEDVSEDDLIEKIVELNKDETVDGILVQLPLPRHISSKNIISAIDPEKDVDGFHPVNAGNLMLGNESYLPATPYGIMLLLEHYKLDIKGKHAVVIGRSNIVGRPISILLSNNTHPGNATVTLTHSQTADLGKICADADIIVAAIGKPGFVKAHMVKDGAIVIDVGINRVDDDSPKGYKITGDVDYENVAPKTSYITPVPGGVGLMTIAALLKNTLKSRLLRI